MSEGLFASQSAPVVGDAGGTIHSDVKEMLDIFLLWITMLRFASDGDREQRQPHYMHLPGCLE